MKDYRTREVIEAEIRSLKQELTTLQAQEEFTKRLEVCRITKEKHKWSLTNWEEQVEYREIRSAYSISPVDHYPFSSTLKAQMYCPCGARITYEEEGR